MSMNKLLQKWPKILDFLIYKAPKKLVFYLTKMTEKNEAILQKLDSKLDSKADLTKVRLVLNEKTLVFTRVFIVARPRVELGTLGL